MIASTKNEISSSPTVRKFIYPARLARNLSVISNFNISGAGTPPPNFSEKPSKSVSIKPNPFSAAKPAAKLSGGAQIVISPENAAGSIPVTDEGIKNFLSAELPKKRLPLFWLSYTDSRRQSYDSGVQTIPRYCARGTRYRNGIVRISRESADKAESGERSADIRRPREGSDIPSTVMLI